MGLAGSGFVFGAAALVLCWRIARQFRAVSARWTELRFCIYLTLVGAISAGVYVIGRCGADSALRYDMLALLGAVGLGAWFFAVEDQVWFRRFGVAVIVGLGDRVGCASWPSVGRADLASAGRGEDHDHPESRRAGHQIRVGRLLDCVLHHVHDRRAHHRRRRDASRACRTTNGSCSSIVRRRSGFRVNRATTASWWSKECISAPSNSPIATVVISCLGVAMAYWLLPASVDIVAWPPGGPARVALFASLFKLWVSACDRSRGGGGAAVHRSRGEGGAGADHRAVDAAVALDAAVLALAARPCTGPADSRRSPAMGDCGGRPPGRGDGLGAGAGHSRHRDARARGRVRRQPGAVHRSWAVVAGERRPGR